MTLIELVVSALLAALMTTALANIVWSSARETRQLGRDASLRFPATQLVQQMRVDLINARGMLADPQGITLHGFLGTNAGTQRAMLTPGRVRYEIVPIKGQPVLVRSNGLQREAVWYGCSSLQIESLEQVDPGEGLLPDPEAGGLPDIPSRFRVTLVDQEGQIIWREVIQHHDE